MGIAEELADRVVSLARKCAREEGGEDLYEFDIGTLTIVIMIIEAIVKAWIGCRVDPEEARDMARKPTFLQWRIAVFLIRYHFGWREFRRISKYILPAFAELSQTITEEEIAEAFSEA